ncbi:acyltransferase domain-containing protein [Actinokineospora enzanensis]|uniref:acyltransferase domain-containing protein n=1 Tax=Actinokineospora enzanensis TaxID=155975 RepID=UPI00039CEE14|nr:acyltransferase domain-containing protein [Actinokineospora enzanensis]
MTTGEPRLVCWWGADERAAARMAERVVAALAAGTDPPDPSVAGPGDLVRGAVVAADAATAAARVSAVRPVRARDRPVVLLLPGQGAQQPRMAAGLYRHEPMFTRHVDELLDRFDDRVRAAWLADPAPGPAVFDDLAIAQPLLFAIGHALARVVLGWGLRPAELLGYSVGEFVAATVAGVFAPATAAELLRERVERLGEATPGGMLAVLAPPDAVADLLGGGVAVGAVNAPRQTILAGPDGPLDAVAARLRERGITCRRVRARQPFHSPVIAPACAASIPAVAAVPLSAPVIPVRSAYTTRVLRPDEARDPVFWAMQPAEPVLFHPTLDTLLARDHLLLDIGPGQSLTSLAALHPAVRSGASGVVPLQPAAASPVDDRAALLAAKGRLWAEGSLPLHGSRSI